LPNVVFVFQDGTGGTAKNMADAASHESGPSPARAWRPAIRPESARATACPWSRGPAK
jgi:hypothetical protein